MISLQRAVQRSITSNTTPETDAARRQEIVAVGNPAKRAGLLALHGLVHKHSRLMASLAGVDRRLYDISYLDRGSHSTVYSLGEEDVLKVDQQSIAMSRRERRLHADKMRDEHAAHRTYAGSVILPHEIQIRRHPLDPGQQVVQIIQPFRKIKPLRLLAESEGDIPLVGAFIRQVHQQQPNLIEEISKLAQSSRSLNEDYKLATDITDSNNVGIDVTTGSLIVIDGQPINTASPEVEGAMNYYLDNLEAALNCAAA